MPMESDGPDLPRDPAFNADYTKDQLRYAPHLVFLKELERLDEMMAARVDPYPAYLAWTSGILQWARTDAQFWTDYDAMCEAEDELYAQYGGIGVFEYVAMWRPVWIGVMRRAGMFDSATQHRPKAESSSGIDRVQSRREGRER